MPRLVYRAAARRELAEIAACIARESGNRDAGERFTGKLADHCQHIANLPGLMGRARPELRRHYRTIAFDDYVIVMRHADLEGSRSHFHVVRIIHGRRDLSALFLKRSI